MELLTLLGAIVLAVAVLAYVTAPLWRRSGHAMVRSTIAQELAELTQEHNVNLMTLRDLDFDYQLHKLSDADYRKLRTQYVAQGVTIIQELDARIGTENMNLEDEIEAEVRQRRRRLPTLTCSECGARIAADSQFCAQCGTRL